MTIRWSRHSRLIEPRRGRTRVYGALVRARIKAMGRVGGAPGGFFLWSKIIARKRARLRASAASAGRPAIALSGAAAGPETQFSRLAEWIPIPAITFR